MSDLDLLYTDVEEALRTSLRDLLAARCSPAATTAMYDGDRSAVPGLWRAVAADLGLAGLLVPEHLGGAGASSREAAVVLEELGRALAPVPFLTSSVVATTVLLSAGPTSAGPTALGEELLAELAAGERTAALAVPFSHGPADPDLAAGPAGTLADGSLHGTLTSVAGALEADLLLVPVTTAEGVEVHAVEEATLSPVSSLDMTRQLADVTVDGAPARVVVPAGAGAAAVRAGLRLGAALLASEQLGVAQWCLEETTAHLLQRRQFGRVVGGFQAIKHRLADLYAGVESARAAARYAAATAAAGDPDAVLAACLAQSFCADVAVRAAEECVQLHGGIGMTWEHPAHLYLKRAKADQLALGTPEAHRAMLADLVGLPAAGSGAR